MDFTARLIKLAQYREAIGSVSLSHEQSCKCDVCKAAMGDEKAFGRVEDSIERGK